MRIVDPYIVVCRHEFDGNKLTNIERYGRVCYKSEDNVTESSASRFIRGIIRRGHESVIEHEKVTVKFVVDRGVSHEIVRHRIASYSQESTRYCNYSLDKFDKEITVIDPYWLVGPARTVWQDACEDAEVAYFKLLEQGASPQWARTVLPNSLKTELVTTFNMREWRHFFKLRCATVAHPQMQQVAIPLLLTFRSVWPEIFEDIDYNEVFPVTNYAEVRAY